MSDFNWCHGPSCHKHHTQDRIRGVKGSKVLRTRKIKLHKWNRNSFYSKFCSNSCYNEFANKYVNEIVAIAPRNECLETPIEVTKVKHPADPDYVWSKGWVETKITECDNNDNSPRLRTVLRYGN
jgi:hypothetical protein